MSSVEALPEARRISARRRAISSSVWKVLGERTAAAVARALEHARKMADRRIFTIAFGIILPLVFIVAVALIVLLEMPLMNYMTFFSR